MEIPTYAEIMQEAVEEFVGRRLTDSEARSIGWLSGWEPEVRANVMKLLRDAHRHGKEKMSNQLYE